MRIFDVIFKYAESLELEDLKLEADETKGIGTIQGFKDGAKVNLTINLNPIKIDNTKPTDDQIMDYLSLGYSQVKIADVLGVSQSYVSNVKKKYIEAMHSGLGVNQSLLYNKDFTELGEQPKTYLEKKEEFLKCVRGCDNEEQEPQE